LFAASGFRNLVTGRTRGVAAAAARFLLRAAGVPYAAAMRIRNASFRCGLLRVERAPLPVVSVGNLTLGGTGKTPMVAWVARRLRGEGIRVAIVSRGYGAAAGSRNDEARELELLLPDVPHLQHADRVAAARIAWEELDMQAVVLDDGFQHRRLHRDLDIVLLDALDPLRGRVFPGGLLREPFAGLRRAHVVVLSRADAVDAGVRQAWRQRVARVAPSALWVEAAHRPQCLRNAAGQQRRPDHLQGQRVLAFCGIGNPQGFGHTLEALRCQVAHMETFPDHHPYQRSDLERLARLADAHRAEALVCTLKDLVKIEVRTIGGRPLWCVQIGIDILEGEAELDQRLRALIMNGVACATPDTTQRASLP
jgi:tetraacyldisaccharide 4'-kinase